VKRKYEIDALALKYGFSAKEIEKVCRISDLLEAISAVKFLSDRLSLYGGTALTFIYSPEIVRLSIDLDFNYRHTDNADWGEIRKEIDERLKDVIYRQEYTEADIAINASYPLTRFTVKYTNAQGSEDKFKIEIGYLRRTSILKTDTSADFKHIGTQETFKTRTPIKEELFANKWCTLLYRRTPRDLFDTYQIIKMKFDHNIFRKCAVIESLTHEKPRMNKIDPGLIGQIPIDSNLKNLLQTDKLPEYDFDKITREVEKFTEKHLASMTSNEIKTIDQLYDKRIFNPNIIDDTGLFHERIAEYPAILWTPKQI
jgi:predicted nucleotidyltransferase component of viral defense system